MDMDSIPASPKVKRGRRSRKQISAACQRCRRLKQRCDGVRPSCATCQHASVTCQYDTEGPNESRTQAIRRKHDTLRVSQQAARDSIEWLSAQSPNDALRYLQQLKQSKDPMEELCSLAIAERALQLPARIPGQELFIDASHSIRDMLTAELVSRYPTSFPWPPERESTVPRENRFGSHGSWSANALPSQHPLVQKITQDCDRMLTVFAPSNRSMAALENQESWSKGSPIDHRTGPPMICDTRLFRLKIRFWTTVPISNELAASIISTYLEVEHPIYGFFDANLFLQDLVNQEVQHCSPLLLNSTLFWACCTFNPIYPKAAPFAELFLEESQKLLDAERSNFTGLNVASLMILTIGSICFGKDKLAQKFMIAGISMAEDLHLIGEKRATAQDFGSLTADTVSMLAHAAWGAFNLSCVLAVHFHDVHSGTFTKYPPLLSRPNAVTPSFGNDSGGQQSAVDPPITVSSFPYFCSFWCIAHEIASMFYAAPGPVHQRVPLAFAESKFHRLLAWATALPPHAARSLQMSHNVAEMHICFHATIMDLFRPFLSQGELLSTFATNPRRPEAIFMLSLSHLRALTQYYRATFGGLPPSHTVSWVHGPLYVAPAMIRYERREGWQMDILHCIEACTGLLQSHSVMEGFLRAILGMAVSAGAFSMAQARECLDNLLARRQGTFDILETRFVVDQDLSMESRDAAVGDVLAQRFDEMLFEESELEPAA